ncbi:helix-turn-helix domain-containing protein [Deinococcus ruber]|uniref:Helix-turn-helix domain-containing protein n=1 Tax=Deinococcus ruber TaxID=1848197 RepID=A0A918KUW7_9DEIO|nr:helix-turn-helix domain-containing protein [Deinococcus ruber]GGR34542.1 hypothetical protein GCM10008957_50790 [Deinococcus ruber]
MTHANIIHMPSDQERAQAQAILEQVIQGVTLQELPEHLNGLVQRLLSEVAQGHAVQIVPIHAELGTQEAAELLGVSRPHFVKLLDEGQLPSWKVGTHRRVKLQELLVYRERRNADRQQALQELVDLDQELGLL